jgi:predicted nucleotidyltransferase
MRKEADRGRLRLFPKAFCLAYESVASRVDRTPYHQEVVSLHISIDPETLAEFCRRHYIRRLAVFGSVLRDDFRPDSDVDVLVEFQSDHVPGLDFIAIERELSGLLQDRRVDMVTPKFLSPRLRSQILKSAQPLYVDA